MKNVFLIYSRTERDKALSFSDELEQDNIHIHVLRHQSYSSDWKKNVKRQIEKSDIVVLIQAANSYLNPNIRWEVKTALFLKRPKPVAILQSGDLDFPKWFPRDKPSKKYLWADRFKLKDDIILLDTKDYDIFSKNIDEILDDRPQETMQQLFEQYKMYQQTSEELENRKQNVHNFYLTLNTALLTFFGVIIGWADITAKNKFVMLIIALMAGTAFNLSWINQIERFKIINSAKMRLINSVERQLPLKLYDEEYRIMNNDLNGWKYKNSFKDEKRIPHTFIGMYIVLVVAFAVLAFFGVLSNTPPV